MKWHMIVYVVLMIGMLASFNFVIYKGVEPERGKVEITATAVKDTISAGMTAVSILLPMTIGILGYTLRQNKRGINLFFSACVFFTISLTGAIWNLFRIPGMVNVYNLANDKPTAFYEAIQLFSLFWGVIYLVFGARRIIKDC